MSKAVLISIKPKWCELIASGKKLVEVRKTKPKLETPFKCYIYQTKMKWLFNLLRKAGFDNLADKLLMGLGKVIGEFVCDEIFPIRVFENGSIQDYMCHRMERSCVPYDDIANYIGNDHTGYGWHISDLVIYDKPKELREFRSYNVGLCIDDNGYLMPTHEIKRPPQSWWYVEEVEDEQREAD